MTRALARLLAALSLLLSLGWLAAPKLAHAGEAPVVAADGRALARALRVAGKVEPVFVDQIADMAQAVLDNARDGDVVLCMGAGTIGAVPAQVVALAAATAGVKEVTA